MFGRVDVRNLWAEKEGGLIHYLTKRKNGNINNEKPWLTKYPQFVKFIRTSRNLPMEEFYEEDWTAEQLEIFKEKAKESGARINNVGHYYGADKYCLDKMFIEQAEDVVSMI